MSIDSKTVKYKGTGPFLILDEVENKVVSIDEPLYAVVFIDGVLQVPGKSYDIVGPNIIFTSPLKYYEDKSGKQTVQKVSIVLFYGIDKTKTLTFYDFEPDTYFSVSNLYVQSPNITDFYNWFDNYLGIPFSLLSAALRCSRKYYQPASVSDTFASVQRFPPLKP